MFNNFFLGLCRAGQATDDNIAPALCMLHHSGYNTHARTHPHIPLFHCANGCTIAPSCYAIQEEQKVSVHLMITIQKVTGNVQSVPRQPPGSGGH
jgi:hypothetical protein